MASNNNTNKLVVPGARQALDQMKTEIANEFGVNLGGETTSRQNGSGNCGIAFDELVIENPPIVTYHR